MNTRIDHTAEVNLSSQPQITPGSARRSTGRIISVLDIALTCALALAALIPRILLATQLDLVTDEVVYIQAAKIYLPLLRPLQIGARGWSYNYEHPPFVKLLMGLTISGNAALGHPVSELLAARIPSIFFGTLLVVAVYWLGRVPFGRTIALAAALCLAFSPWMVYFSSLAYLDMTMSTLVSIAYLLLWPAIRRPWFYLLVALLVGLAGASKYPAALALPGMLLFTASYFFVFRRSLPPPQRPAIPWLWWIGAIILAPLVFLATDPAIWPHPIALLLHSFRFEERHSVNGHLTFFAGKIRMHMPQWTILSTLFVKISAFVTLPAIFFACFALVQLVRFHLRKPGRKVRDAARIAFLFLWLVCTLISFAQLDIVVGTHYFLPAAAPLALSGAFGLTLILRSCLTWRLTLERKATPVIAAHEPNVSAPSLERDQSRQDAFSPRATAVCILLLAALAIPHLVGLVTIPQAEGYASEFFHGEDSMLQVAYPGYREAVQWLAAHTHGPASVGLVALPDTLGPKKAATSWYVYNRGLPARLQLTEVHPTDDHLPYDYLVWPMHLVQRGYAIPAPWHSHVVHVVIGGDTIYCYILAHDKDLVLQKVFLAFSSASHLSLLSSAVNRRKPQGRTAVARPNQRQPSHSIA
jgi:4-amino-4-deoxy-L-arabinose transferase-like glycosyltransferase